MSYYLKYENYSMAEYIASLEKQIKDIKNKINNGGIEGTELIEIRSQINNLRYQINSLSNTINSNNTNLTSQIQNIKSEFKSQLDNKVSEDALNVERQRINQLAKLQEGSTTGDAELIDGRVGADGIVYTNIGDANRSQFKKINDNIFKETRLLTDVNWVLKHIDVSGDIVPNNNKNVVTEQRNLLKKGSNITVDNANYKFQIALYNKNTSGFIQRITWMQYGTVYQLDDDYLVRIEVSDKNESVQSDTSISSHVKVFVTESLIKENTNNIQLNADKIKENKNSIQNINSGIIDEISNVVDIIGIDFFKRKPINITKEEKYNAWSMISIVNNKLVCLYTRVNNHEDYSGSLICAKTSSNGVVWDKEKIVITNSKTRSSVTGKGVLGNNALFWVRTNGSPTKYELYSMGSNYTFSKISEPSFTFDYGHIGDIINIPTVGLLSFYNTYSDNRTWGVIVSRDNGITWEQTFEAECENNSECPTEISGVYLQDGKILAIGRKDIYGGTYAQFQIQSSDYGQTWSINYTNITDISMSTASLIYNSETNEITNYYFDRGTALKVRKNNVNDVWNNPLNWANSERLVASCGNIQDEGNVNVIELNGNHMVTYYMGDSNNTNIYNVIN